MKAIKAMLLLGALLLVLPTATATNVPQFLRVGLGNCTAFADTPNPLSDCELFTSTGGSQFVEIYSTFGGATATMQYSSDWDGTDGTWENVPVPTLVGITSEAKQETLVMGLGYAYQLIITGGTGESITWSVSSREGV